MLLGLALLLTARGLPLGEWNKATPSAPRHGLP